MATRDAKKPIVSSLSDAECRAILSRNHIGRLAFTNENRIDIEPISYVADGAWLFMRSGIGAKLESLAHRPYVALEVDEVKSPLDWESVVVRGTIYWMSDDTRGVDDSLLDRAIGAIRSIQQHAFSEGDPTPFRRTIYGLHIDVMTGRRSEVAPRAADDASVNTSTTQLPHHRSKDGS